MTFDVVHVDADGVPWTTSDDPAVRMECERGPVQTEDGTWRRARLVHLRPGYILEDVVHDHDSAPNPHKHNMQKHKQSQTNQEPTSKQTGHRPQST